MGLQKRLASFRYAFKGLYDLFRTQPNARIHLLAAAVAIIAASYFRISTLEWVALLLCIGAVISLEAVNTALEYLTDLVSPGRHPLAGKAKDVAAAAVLVAAMTSVVVALLIFFPRIKGG
ncbi:MAG: diacylglycerol kinase family protein [Saprospiraceae bacterium]|nr:diacylglycerol kinase family protein [Saprospiraceae bacterium]